MKQMRKLAHGMAIAAALAGLSASASAEPGANSLDASKPALRIKVGEPFIAARARLIKSGWLPVRIERGDYGISGTETILAEHNMHEFESCSMSAGSLCIFYYSKRGQCLRVDTIGEQLRHMKVTRWVKECPGPFE